MSGCESCGADVAAYALGALEPGEARSFLRHLDACAVCRDELAAFRHVTDALPLAVPQLRAPRRLRRRVLGAVAAQRRQSRLAPLGRVARPWVGRPRLGLAPAGATALALGVLALALTLAGGIELGRNAPATRSQAASITGIPGSASLRVTGTHAELVVHHVPPPAAGHIYELWRKRGGRPAQPTTALFSVNAAGDGDVAVPGGVAGVRQVLVTQEPAGGSLVPTPPVLITADVA